jgi:hypothetical protein
VKPTPYLSELIPVPGYPQQLKPRGKIISDLQAEGLPQRYIDLWMMASEQRKPLFMSDPNNRAG